MDSPPPRPPHAEFDGDLPPASLLAEIRQAYRLGGGHPTHGARLVAITSFGTVLLVSLVLFALAALTQQAYPVYLSLLAGVGGAIGGYSLWNSGSHGLASTLHVAGLQGAALLCLVATGSLAGPTGILFLASVITAGGLLGWRAVVLDLLASLAVFVLGSVYTAELRSLLAMPAEPYVVPEILLAGFVLASLPAWGSYIVAVDTSNRVAWLRAHASTVRSTEVIQSQRDEIERLRVAGALRERRLAQTEALADLHRFAKDRPRFLEAVEALLERWQLAAGDRPTGLTGANSETDEVSAQDADFLRSLSALLDLHGGGAEGRSEPPPSAPGAL